MGISMYIFIQFSFYLSTHHTTIKSGWPELLMMRKYWLEVECVGVNLNVVSNLAADESHAFGNARWKWKKVPHATHAIPNLPFVQSNL